MHNLALDDGTEKAARPSGSAAILIVDDDGPLRGVLTALLEAHGYRATAVSGCPEARRALREQEYAVVLVDLYMPGSNGLELIDALHRHFPHIRVAAMSGHPLNSLPKNLLTGMFRVDAFLQKPISAEQLVETLRQLGARADAKDEFEPASANSCGKSWRIPRDSNPQPPDP
jgi:DNA-binding NtrC family response regulator